MQHDLNPVEEQASPPAAPDKPAPSSPSSRSFVAVDDLLNDNDALPEPEDPPLDPNLLFPDLPPPPPSPESTAMWRAKFATEIGKVLRALEAQGARISVDAEEWVHGGDGLAGLTSEEKEWFVERGERFVAEMVALAEEWGMPSKGEGRYEMVKALRRVFVVMTYPVLHAGMEEDRSITDTTNPTINAMGRCGMVDLIADLLISFIDVHACPHSSSTGDLEKPFINSSRADFPNDKPEFVKDLHNITLGLVLDVLVAAPCSLALAFGSHQRVWFEEALAARGIEPIKVVHPAKTREDRDSNDLPPSYPIEFWAIPCDKSTHPDSSSIISFHPHPNASLHNKPPNGHLSLDFATQLAHFVTDRPCSSDCRTTYRRVSRARKEQGGFCWPGEALAIALNQAAACGERIETREQLERWLNPVSRGMVVARLAFWERALEESDLEELSGKSWGEKMQRGFSKTLTRRDKVLENGGSGGVDETFGPSHPSIAAGGGLVPLLSSSDNHATEKWQSLNKILENGGSGGVDETFGPSHPSIAAGGGLVPLLSSVQKRASAQKYTTSDDWSLRIKNHQIGTIFRCEVIGCKKTWVVNPNLFTRYLQHLMRSTHLNIRPFVCPVARCDFKGSVTKGQMEIHLSSLHPKIKIDSYEWPSPAEIQKEIDWAGEIAKLNASGGI